MRAVVTCADGCGPCLGKRPRGGLPSRLLTVCGVVAAWLKTDSDMSKVLIEASRDVSTLES